ncbi:MAG: D-alanyl-D-alanine carboxypeptidase family protein [Microcoleaceae cyanobacterium]
MVVVSGFRTIVQQQKLWNKKVQSLNSEQKAAKFSPPPGYSKNHTSYAVDLGDDQLPNLDLIP